MCRERGHLEFLGGWSPKVPKRPLAEADPRSLHQDAGSRGSRDHRLQDDSHMLRPTSPSSSMDF